METEIDYEFCLITFQSITNCEDVSIAYDYLNQTGWNPERATSLYFEKSAPLQKGPSLEINEGQSRNRSNAQIKNKSTEKKETNSKVNKNLSKTNQTKKSNVINQNTIDEDFQNNLIDILNLYKEKSYETVIFYF